MAVVQVRSVQVGDGAGCAEVCRDAGEYFATLNPGLDRDLGRTRVQVTVLAVSKKYRGPGAEVMLLETETNNGLSVPFYNDRMGFEARLVTFRKDLHDS